MAINPFVNQIYCVPVFILALCITAFAQTDAERFAEGRTALDKFKDCPAALKALEEVSADGRKNPLWMFYMAKTTECLNRFSDALRFYEDYDRMIPGQTAVLDKIGELRYAIRKSEEALREEAKYGSLQETKEWLSKNAVEEIDTSGESCVGQRLVNFNGSRMLSEHCHGNWKDSVALEDLDPQKVTVFPGSWGTSHWYFVHCKCRSGSKCRTTDQGAVRTYFDAVSFDFATEERATSVAFALRHAIRLSQQ
jgi:hypothetical protein